MTDARPFLNRRLSSLALYLLITGTLCCGPRAEASLALSPSTFSNTYLGAFDLTITGLDSAGQSVVVEEFFDGDDSATINAGDVLLRKFNVTDGQVTSVGGQRNLNIAGDEDGAANAGIVTRLHYGAGEIMGRIDGRHIFRVSPSGAGFTPFTANLIVTQQDYAGSGLSGTVMGGAPLMGQPGAFVVLQTAGNDGDLVAVTVAGAGGNYSLKAAPGNYSILAAKSGFVFDTGAGPAITVPSGSFTTGETATLTPSGRTISGAVRDAVSLTGVPVLPIAGESNTGFFSFTLSDSSGSYVMDATTEPWGINFIERAAATHGLLASETSEGSAGSVTGFNLDLPRATSLIYGSLKTPANVAVPFVEVRGQTNGAPEYKSAAITDANGNYTLGALPTSWRVHAEAMGYLGREETVVVNTNGSAVLQNLIFHPITAHIRGQVRDNQNNPVPFLRILARDPSGNGGNEVNAVSQSDGSGNFDLGVYGGGGMNTQAWQLQINQSDEVAMYVSTSPIFQVQDGVDINGVTYLVYAVTAHLRGQVLDENDGPIGNVNVSANGGPNGDLLSGGNADGGGNFDLGVFAGTWNLGLSNIQGLGLIPQNFSTTVTDGVDQNNLIFRARHTSATISGTVKNSAGVPIAGVTVSSNSTISGADYQTSTTTDPSGSYSLPVFSTTWNVSVTSSDLFAQGYSPVSNQSVFVNAGTVAVNFVANSLLRSAAVTRNGNNLVLTVDAFATKTYRLERKSTLSDANWQTVIGVADQTPSVNGPASFAHVGAISSSPGFYRVRLLP